MQLRACGICGLKDIPRGVDWPYWVDGCPVHFACAVTLGGRRHEAHTNGRTLEALKPRE